jgi:hypothetical protein
MAVSPLIVHVKVVVRSRQQCGAFTFICGSKWANASELCSITRFFTKKTQLLVESTLSLRRRRKHSVFRSADSCGLERGLFNRKWARLLARPLVLFPAD